MQVFVYDKTFEGLLAVVFDSFTLKLFPTQLYGPNEALPLTASAVHTVEPSPEKTRRVFTALQKKLSKEALKSVMYTWLSEISGSDLSLYGYICKTLRAAKSIEGNMADADVWEIVRLRRKVGKEVERYLGFVRFQKSREGVYFSAFAPKYNVIPALCPLMAERFHDQEWILYDLARHYGVKFTPSAGGGGFEEIFIDEKRLDGGFLREEYLAEGEMLLEDMWRSYINTAAIRERANPRLQMNFMPKRFWKHLTEKRRPPQRGPVEADLL